MKKHVLLCFCLIGFFHCRAQFSSLLDKNSYIMFANNTDLQFMMDTKITGVTDSVTLGQLNYIPWELSNNHDFGDQATAVALGVIFKIDPHHSERKFLAKCNRSDIISENESYTVYVYVKHNTDTLFTIYFEFKDDNNSPGNKAYYNVIYPDGSSDSPMPGNILTDDHGHRPIEAQRNISIDGKLYKLVYGSFDQELDPTDNVIYSLSEVNPDNFFQRTPDVADQQNPNILNIWTYNPGMLKPLGYSDNEEDARANVMHLAIPDNLDFIVFEEWFEPDLTKKMLDSLTPRYPYHTTIYNEPEVPGISKHDGVIIVSAHPILEEQKVSFSDNGCISDNPVSALANKGVKYARINKNGQIIHVFGTHTSVQPCDLYVMGNFISQFNIAKEDIVVFAGDFNVDMDQFQSDGLNIYQVTLDTLHAIEPTYQTLTQDYPYRATFWGIRHYQSGAVSEKGYIDYVLSTDKYKMPYKMDNYTQIAMVNNTNKKFWGTFDLGDHNPVYAHFEFPALSVSVNDTAACVGDHIVLNAESNIPDATFQWFKNDTLIDGAAAETFVIDPFSDKDYGHFTCRMYYSYMPDTNINRIPVSMSASKPYIFRGVHTSYIDASIIISEDNCMITGVGQPVASHPVIFPNPTHQNIWLKNFDQANLNNNMVVEIYSQDGRLLSTQTIQGKSQEINMEDLSKGIYTIKIRQKEVIIYVEKVIKL